MQKVIAVVITLFFGYLGLALGVGLMNWPDLGTIFAVISMGLFIWNALEKKN